MESKPSVNKTTKPLLQYGYTAEDVKMPDLPPTKSDLKMHVMHKKMDKRAVSTSTGYHIPGVAAPRPDFDDPVFMATGVLKRFGSKNHEFDLALKQELISFTDSILDEMFHKYGLDRLESLDYSVEDWLSDINAPATRKQQLREAAKEVFNPKKHVKIDMFIKDEPYEGYKYPRLINSRHDVFKARVGPMFKRIEKALFSLPMFIKKIPVSERMQYLKDYLYEPGGIYYDFDFEAFETIFGPDFMQAIEFRLYERLVPNDKCGAQFMDDIQYLLGKNFCKNVLLYVWILATRMSGEQNTSLGNSFSNYVIHRFVAHKSGAKAVGVVEGDDGCFRFSKLIDESWYKRLGVKVKIIINYDLGYCSFCGLLQEDTSKQNLCNPYKVLSRFGWTNRQYVGAGHKTLNALARAKALSYAYQYPHMPIVRSFMNMVLRTTKDDKYRMLKFINRQCDYERDLFIIAMNAKIEQAAPTMATRLMFEELFGLSVRQQLEAEAYLDQITEKQPINLKFDFPSYYHDCWDKFVTTCSSFASVIAYKEQHENLLKRISKHATLDANHLT